MTVSANQKRPPQIVIVGGGPIGFFTGIQIALKAKTPLKIAILEKNAVYTRTQKLFVSAHSFWGAARSDELDRLVKKWQNRFVPIQDIEKGLAQIAHQLGIQVLYGQRVDQSYVKTHYKDASVVICADGAKSLMRQEIFQNRFRFDDSLQYMVQVNYKVQAQQILRQSKGKVFIKKVQDFAEKQITQKYAGHIVEQTIAPQVDGSKKIALRIFIDQKTYLKIQQAKFKHPYYLETDLGSLPNPLKRALKMWWGARKLLHGETIIPTISGAISDKRKGKNTITAVALRAYGASRIVKTRGKRFYILVGDAAGAFPFFRAFNCGVLMAKVLASQVARGFSSSNSDFDPSFLWRYQIYASFRLRIEQIKALVKNFFVNIYSYFLRQPERSSVLGRMFDFSSSSKLDISPNEMLRAGDEIFTSLQNG